MRFLKKLEKEYGNNAGKVWRAISTHGKIDEAQLKKITRLDENQLYIAVGWLARENKICKVNKRYYLGETNLTDKIGTDAGIIWHTLNDQSNIDISSITKFTKIQKKDAYSALGWLARENKIDYSKKSKDKNPVYYLK